jgi:hypothetical protein
MATKERAIQIIESLPDTPETESRLDSVVHDLEPPIKSLGREGGASNGNGEELVDEAPVPTLQEVFEIFASVDFLPREDAWH